MSRPNREPRPDRMFEDPFAGCLYSCVSAVVASVFGVWLLLTRRSWAMRTVIAFYTLMMSLLAFGAGVELRQMERDHDA